MTRLEYSFWSLKALLRRSRWQFNDWRARRRLAKQRAKLHRKQFKACARCNDTGLIMSFNGATIYPCPHCDNAPSVFTPLLVLLGIAAIAWWWL